MKNFELQLNDNKLTLELLFALFKALLEHLELDYEIEDDTGGYIIKITKKMEKKPTKEQKEKYELYNKLIKEFNEKADTFTSELLTIEREIDNIRLMLDLNYKLRKNGLRPIMMSYEEQVKLLAVCIKELKQIRNK